MSQLLELGIVIRPCSASNDAGERSSISKCFLKAYSSSQSSLPAALALCKLANLTVEEEGNKMKVNPGFISTTHHCDDVAGRGSTTVFVLMCRAGREWGRGVWCAVGDRRLRMATDGYGSDSHQVFMSSSSKVSESKISSRTEGFVAGNPSVSDGPGMITPVAAPSHASAGGFS